MFRQSRVDSLSGFPSDKDLLHLHILMAGTNIARTAATFITFGKACDAAFYCTHDKRTTHWDEPPDRIIDGILLHQMEVRTFHIVLTKVWVSEGAETCLRTID